MSSAPSRGVFSVRNASVSVASQILIVVLGFVTRSVFIAQLGVALLGVNSVLMSALAMLTLADLGINGALLYALYGPLRDGDTVRVAAIVGYAQRLFRWVACIVAATGLAAAPFIRRLVRLGEPVPYLEVYYLVLLCNAVAGYLMLSRIVLLEADQKIYITKIYSMIFNTLRSVVQIVSLIAFGSFLTYLVVQVLFTVANNLVVYVRAGKMYPFLKCPENRLDLSERESIMESVRALVVFRVGGLVLQNSGPMLISVIVGTLALGYYSNYMLIVGSAAMVTEVAFSALTPSIGNLIAEGSRDGGRRLFREIVLLSTVLHGSIAVLLVALVGDFVELWLGADFVLPLSVAVAIAVNFYVVGTLMPMWSFRNATGLFRRTQWVILSTALLSIAMSFLLGTVYGLAAVVIAPALARLLTGGWYEPWLLLRDHLADKASPYFVLQAVAFLLWAAIAGMVIALGSVIDLPPLPSMGVKVAVLAVVLPAAVWLTFGRLEAFRGLVGRVRSLVARPGGAS